MCLDKSQFHIKSLCIGSFNMGRYFQTFAVHIREFLLKRSKQCLPDSEIPKFLATYISWISKTLPFMMQQTLPMTADKTNGFIFLINRN